MKKVIVTAPGKVIIHGEHAVVYGKVCVKHDAIAAVNTAAAAYF